MNDIQIGPRNKNRPPRYFLGTENTGNEPLMDAQWIVWKNQGRTPTGQHSISDYQGAYAQLAAQDRQLKQYYELATGKPATPEIMYKYSQYANDPALLEAAISKDLQTATFDITLPTQPTIPTQPIPNADLPTQPIPNADLPTQPTIPNAPPATPGTRDVIPPPRYFLGTENTGNEPLMDAQWIVWKNQGRTPTGQHSISDYQGAYAQLAAQDRQLKQYYELATGKPATPEIMYKYSQYANDPALLSAAIDKDLQTATFDTTTPEFDTTTPDTQEPGGRAPEPGGRAQTPEEARRIKILGDIKTMVQDTLGRAPTNAELEYFGKNMQQGNLDAYGLTNFLQGTAEYQNKTSDVARTKLAGELGAVDTTYLNKIQSGLESRYAAMGRPGASAFGAALINAGKDLATERTGYLAGLGYQDFQRGQNTLTNAYQNRLAQMYQQQQQGAQLGAESRQRYYSQQDQERRYTAAERLMRLSRPRQQSFLQSLLPGLMKGGLELGATMLGAPEGA